MLKKEKKISNFNNFQKKFVMFIRMNKNQGYSKRIFILFIRMNKISG